MAVTLKGHNKFLLKNLNKLRAKYGEPYDIVGGLDIEILFWTLIATDNQKIKNIILMKILQYFSDTGYGDTQCRRKTFEDDAEANTIFLKCGVKGI